MSLGGASASVRPPISYKRPARITWRRRAPPCRRLAARAATTARRCENVVSRREALAHAAHSRVGEPGLRRALRGHHRDVRDEAAERRRRARAARRRAAVCAAHARVDALVAVHDAAVPEQQVSGLEQGLDRARGDGRVFGVARGVKLHEGPEEPVAARLLSRASACADRLERAIGVRARHEHSRARRAVGRVKVEQALERAAVRAVDFGVLPPQPGSVGERWVETCAGRAAVRHERGNFSRKRKGGAAFALTWSKWNQPGEIRQLSRAPARNGLRCAPAPSKLVSSRAAGWAPVSGSPHASANARRTAGSSRQPQRNLDWPRPRPHSTPVFS